jgi:hypothetical protein
MRKLYKCCIYPCLIFCSILFISSCGQPVSNQTTKIISNLKNELIKLKFPDSKIKDSIAGLLSSLASEVEYIPLETTPDCLLGGNFVDITPSLNGYFIKYLDVVYRFSDDGKFLCRINTVGRGPNEYKCKSFFVDDTNKIIVSTGFYNDVFFFSDLNGIVQKTIRYPKHEAPKLQIEAIRPLGNDRFIAIYYNDGGQSRILFSILDYQGNILYEELNTHIVPDTYRIRNMSITFGTNYGFYTCNGQLYYLNNSSDTIFSIREDFYKEVHALIDAGGNKMTIEEEIKISAEIISSDLYKHRRSNFFAGESDRFLFLHHYSFGKGQLAVWDKANGSAIYNYYPYFIDDINHFKSIFVFPTRVKDNCLYTYIESLDFIEYFKKNRTNERIAQNARIKTVMGKITEASNPVIIKVKLKMLPD